MDPIGLRSPSMNIKSASDLITAFLNFEPVVSGLLQFTVSDWVRFNSKRNE